ncbi:hypothetical protein [Fenollaria massiliensis]|uniref:hypothetical protein n=1 Tax=Fenollaria massiliensis TaxID=938288 RepID=UPI00036DE26C|nr:hypothetical protein [Fenollaria massiliensis]
MFNFIKAEVFRISKRKYNVGLYIFGFVMCALVLYIFSGLKRRGFAGWEVDRDLSMMFFTLGQILSLASILIPLMVNLTALEPYASGAINNNLALGQSRIKIYLANAIISFLYILVYMIIMCTILIGVGAIIAPISTTPFADMMKNFLIGFAYLLPCLWFYVSLVLFFQILTRHRSSAIAISYVAMSIFQPVLYIIINKFKWDPRLIILAPSRIVQSITGMMGSYDLAFLQSYNYTDKILNVYNNLYIMLGWIALVWAGIYFVGRKREF